MAACSAFEVTLYVSKDCEVNFAACFAVAHSPAAGASVQDLEEGAMVTSWDSVRAALPLRLRVKREVGRGVAVVWRVRVRVRVRRRVWRCILEVIVPRMAIREVTISCRD